VQGELVITMEEVKQLLLPQEPNMSTKRKDVDINAVVQVQLVDNDGKPLCSYKSTPT